MEERVLNSLINAGILLLILFMQLLIPYISRRNILLGVKIPGEKVEDSEVKKIVRGFIGSNILIGVIFIFLISYGVYASESIAFLTLAPLIFMGILFPIHIVWNRKLKLLKEKRGWDRLASNIVVVDTKFSRNRSKEKGMSKWWILLPSLIVIGNILLVLLMYPSLPSKLPTNWDLKGNINGYMNKSILAALMMPIFQVFMGMIMYFSYYAMMKSKQEIDSSNPELSLKKNLIFRRIWGLFFLVSAVLLELLLTVINMMILGIVKDFRLFTIANILVIGGIVGGSIILSLILGQGGDRLRLNNEEDSLGRKYDMDDDRLWKLGNSIYYNPEDPSIIVEKRIGVGWTVNVGRPLGMLLLILPLITIIITLFLVK